jgi:hypothetical protein
LTVDPVSRILNSSRSEFLSNISGHGFYDRGVVSPNLQIKNFKVAELPILRKANESIMRVRTDRRSASTQVEFWNER